MFTGAQRMKICEPFCPEECNSTSYLMAASFSKIKKYHFISFILIEL